MKIAVIGKKKKDYNYFDNFTSNIECGVKSAEIVYDLISEYKPEEMEKKLIEIHEIEHKADDGKHVMVNYLAKDFLPPIEREDILSLSQKIDDVTDLIEEILINMDMFNMNAIRPGTIEFANLLKDITSHEYELIKEFKNFKKSTNIKRLVININKLEEDGDKLYIDAMRRIYRDGTSTLDIIRWTTIYNCFEDCFDVCESLANDIENVMLKNI